MDIAVSILADYNENYCEQAAPCWRAHRRTAGKRKRAVAVYVPRDPGTDFLDVYTRGIARGVRQSLREIAQERIARELGAAIAPPPYPPSNTIAFIEACLVSQASGRWADVASA
jgi:hypothetical protein